MGWWKDIAARIHLPRSNVRDAVGILAVMPYNTDRRVLVGAAERFKWRLEFAATRDSALDKLRDHQFAIILCDRDLPEFDWRHVIEVLLARSPDSCVILVSPVNDDYLWQEVIQRGGYDVLTKPFQEEKVHRVIDLAWSYWTVEKAPPR